MNMRPVLFVLCIALLVPSAPAIAAASKHEQNLQREAASLDRTATTPQGEQAVLSRLNRDFPVTGEQIAALRGKGLGYGEITIALSCAQSMYGGATEENVGRVLALRQGPPALGWGVVAKQLGIKLGKCVSQVKKVNNESHREIKKGRIKGRGRAVTAPTATAEPQAPLSQHKHHEFTGEGKAMTRGPAAQ